MEELYHSYEGSALLGGAKKKLKLNMKKHHAHHAHYAHPAHHNIVKLLKKIQKKHHVTKTHVTKAHVKRSYVPKKAHSSLLRYERLKATTGLSPIQEKRYRELKHAHGGAMLGGEMLGGEMLGGEMLGGEMLGGAKLIGLAQQHRIGLAHHAGALLGGDGGALLGGKEHNKKRKNSMHKRMHMAPIKLRYRKFPSPKEYKAKYSRKPRVSKPPSPAQREARARFSEATALVRSGVPRAEAFHTIFGASKSPRKAPVTRKVHHVGSELYVINPYSNRRVSVGSPTYRRLVREGVLSSSESQMLRTKHSEIARNARRPAHNATYNIEKQREAIGAHGVDFPPAYVEEYPTEEYPPEYFAAGHKKRHYKKHMMY